MSYFTGGIAVITGGGSGIGAALAREVARRGAKVALGDIQMETAQAVADDIVAAGGAAHAYHVDVSDPASVDRFAVGVAGDLGGVNFVFANAGVIVGGGLPETSAADFAWMYAVNVTGLFLTVQAFLPSVLAQAAAGHPAHIVTTGSENSVGLPVTGPSTAYTGTKHAVLGLSAGLRRDLLEDGVKVTVICPGVVATNLADGRRARQDQYGGAEYLQPEQAEMIAKFMEQHARKPEETALLACEGVERGDLIVITDPTIRGLVETRSHELEAALDVLDARLATAKA